MSANDFLIDSATRHQIYVQRYAGGQVKQLLTHLNNLVGDVQRELNAARSLHEAQRLTVKLSTIQDLIGEAIDALGSELAQNMDDFARYEAEFAVRAVNQVSTVAAALPADPILSAIVTDKPMRLLTGTNEEVVTIQGAIEQFSSKKKTEITRLIQRGFVDGKTSAEVTSSVGRLVETRTRNQVNALVRTSVNHISSEARAATHATNMDILRGEEWVSVLDGNTTVTCASLDGEVFPLNRGPTTPRHWNCRSVRVPALKPEYTIAGKSGTRASMHGPVSAKRTYSGWLRDQSPEFQDSVLGRDRGELFRSKGLSLDKFTDDSGRVYSLDELRSLEPTIFN